MASFTMADLKRMREAREARIAANKANLNNTEREYLNVASLPKGVKLWYPAKDKPEEITMRIVDFMTTKENNTAGNPVGTFDAFRKVRVHKLADGRMVVCPTSYGRKCPLCECVTKHYEEIKNDRNSPWAKLKPRKLLLFNMLVKIADESGKTKLIPRVFRGTEFYFMDVFNSTLATEEQFNGTKADRIYNFSDLDSGYWMDARFGMAPSVKANPQSKPIMQLLSLMPKWKEDSKPIPESFYPYIADLDELIPDAPSYTELAKFVDDTPVNVAGDKEVTKDAEPELTLEEDAGTSAPEPTVEAEQDKHEPETAKEPETTPAPDAFGEQVGGDLDLDLGDFEV